MNPATLNPLAAADITAHAVVAIVAIGMGLAFFLADRTARTSRALSLFLVAMGFAVVTNVFVSVRYSPEMLPSWARFVALFETIAFVAGFEWGIRVARTVSKVQEHQRRGERLVRVAQGLVLLYGAISITLPQLRARYFLSQAAAPDLHSSDFYMFAVPLVLAGLLVLTAALLLLRDRPDRAERIRILGLLFAMPFLASGLVMPYKVGALGMALGLVIFLVSAVQYHVMQGRRGQFLARFLSPQVANLVHETGLRNAMRTQRLVISVVACDLRGFTAFAKATDPDRVIGILREYYRAVGQVAARFGGTIKDQAGDGILILVGAPIAYADHAQRAIDMAREILAQAKEVTARWSDERLKLGVGVGVASGNVSVGVIGDASRLEYTAVGTAVNLAARLCDKAADGTVRIDVKTVNLCSAPPDARAAEPIPLKGFSQPVESYII